MSSTSEASTDLSQPNDITLGSTRQRKDWLDLSWSDRWRAHLVRAPRRIPRASLRLSIRDGPYPFVVKIPSRFSGHRIPVWIYLPSLQGPGQTTDDVSHVNGTTKHTIPLHIDFHGGGFVSGGPREQAPFCAKLARERGCVVLSVDYSLGPLAEFPAAVEDAEDVLRACMDDKQVTDAGKTLYGAIGAHRMQLRRYRRTSTGSLTEEELRLDPKRLSLSGVASGANLALNLVLSTGEQKATSLHHKSDTDIQEQRAWPSRIPKDVRSFPVFLLYPQIDQQNAHPAVMGKQLASAYLPENLKSHIRASPCLAPANAIHSKANFFVVLPQRNLSTESSHEWVQRMRDAGWDDGRIRTLDTPSRPSEISSVLKSPTFGEMTKFWNEFDPHPEPEVKRSKSLNLQSAKPRKGKLASSAMLT